MRMYDTCQAKTITSIQKRLFSDRDVHSFMCVVYVS